VSALRVVVAGAAAGIFSAHRRGLTAIDAEVVAVQDVNQERVAGVAAELGCPVRATLAELLAEEADLAVILAPHPFHAELAIAALRSGKHVLTEKPIAVEVAEADRMVAEAELSRRVLAVGFQQRTRLEVKEAKRLIGEGFLGELQRADVLGTWPRRKTYFEVSPWRGSWRGEGGGVLVNQGQHDLDLLCHLAGAPARVVGWTRTRLHRIEAEDTAHAMLEWPNGAIGSVHLSTVEVDVGQRIELTGTAGRLRLQPGKLETAANGVDFREFAASAGDPFGAVPEGPVAEFGGGGGDHADLYCDLADALAEGRPPIAPGREAATALELANAIIYSSHTSSEIALPLDRAAYSSLLDSLRSAAGSPA
jgi:predicted dehydrogenase